VIVDAAVGGGLPGPVFDAAREGVHRRVECRRDREHRDQDGGTGSEEAREADDHCGGRGAADRVVRRAPVGADQVGVGQRAADEPDDHRRLGHVGRVRRRRRADQRPDQGVGGRHHVARLWTAPYRCVPVRTAV
jgi:hypothetical protein